MIVAFTYRTGLWGGMWGDYSQGSFCICLHFTRLGRCVIHLAFLFFLGASVDYLILIILPHTCQLITRRSDQVASYKAVARSMGSSYHLSVPVADIA